jgi:hypothetical protein
MRATGMLRHWFFTNPLIHFRVFVEVIFVDACGLLAFLALPFVRHLHISILHAQAPEMSLYDTVSRGELFPFCFGLAGGVLWLAGQEFRGKGIPLRPLILLLLAALSFSCIVVYAIQPQPDSTLPSDVVYLSYLAVTGYILLHYYLLVIKELPGDPVQRELDEDSTAMIRRASSRRRARP